MKLIANVRASAPAIQRSLCQILVPTLGILFWGTVATRPASAQDWIRTSAPLIGWTAVASSADGSKLVAVGDRIYTSTNFGVTWISNSAPSAGWYSVASSADGAKLVAVAAGLAHGIYLSTNSGANWTLSSAPLLDWYSVTSSADGNTLAAVDGNVIYMSTNSGKTWSASASPTSGWRWVTSSADGTKIVAVSLNKVMYRSTDSGATWTPVSAPSGIYDCIASSADGTKLVTSTFEFGNGGYMYSSSDSGLTWITNNAPNLAWSCIASSVDGSRLFICMKETFYAPSGGPIYFSTNSGASWLAGSAPATNDWLYIATSADGCRSVAVDFRGSGGIYTWQSTPTPKLTITPFGNQLRVSWIIPSMKFVLQENSDLTTTNWTDIATPPTVTNLDNQVQLPTSPGSRFYRLKGDLIQ